MRQVSSHFTQEENETGIKEPAQGHSQIFFSDCKPNKYIINSVIIIHGCMYKFQHFCCLHHMLYFGFLALHPLWDTTMFSLASSSPGLNNAKPLLWGTTVKPFSSSWALLSAQNQLTFLDLLLGYWKIFEDSQRPHMPEPVTFTVPSSILGCGPHPLSYCHQKVQVEASYKFPLSLAFQLQGKFIILPLLLGSAWGSGGRKSLLSWCWNFILLLHLLLSSVTGSIL